MAPRRLLFVCTGNLCRSPMAAALADRAALQHALDVELRSAGTARLVGQPAHPRVVAVCREIGLDLEGHRSSALDEEVVRWAERVYVMENEHAVAVRALAPDLGEEVLVQLGPLIGKARIDDPIGAWFTSTYRRCRDDLQLAVDRALTGLSPRKPGTG